MVLAEAWARYWRSWKALVAVNLFSQLVALAFGAAIVWLVMGELVFAGPSLTPQQFLQMGTRMLVWGPIAGIFAVGFVQGGLVGTVAAVWRDPDTGWTTFWVQGWRNWWRMIRIGVMTMLGIALPAMLGLLLLGLVIHLLPLPAILSGLLYLVLGVCGLLPITGAISYGAYAAVADGAGGRHAVREGWRCFTVGYADCLAAAAVQIGLGLLFAAVMIPIALIMTFAGVPPLLGQVVTNLIQIIIAPTFMILYIAVRYETNQRPC